jgi:hypothetical protein
MASRRIGTCQECGQSFRARTSTQRFCSEPCYRADRRGKPLVKTCLACGKPFTRSPRNKLLQTSHCSRQCAGDTQRRVNIDRRYSMVVKHFGVMTHRELAIWAHAYKLGYLRRKRGFEAKIVRQEPAA